MGAQLLHKLIDVQLSTAILISFLQDKAQCKQLGRALPQGDHHATCVKGSHVDQHAPSSIAAFLMTKKF